MNDKERLTIIRKDLKECKPVFRKFKDNIENMLEHLRKDNPKNPTIGEIYNKYHRGDWLGNELAIYEGGYKLHGNLWKVAKKSIENKLGWGPWNYAKHGGKPPQTFYEGKTDQYGTPWLKSRTPKGKRAKLAQLEAKKRAEAKKKPKETKPHPQYTPEARAKRKKRAQKKQRERKEIKTK